ncbi:MAG: YciI family protein [Candidatus Dormibacteraceae bacterium]
MGQVPARASKFVVLYESSEDVLPKARQHFQAHRARYEQFITDGTLLMIGTFANPQDDGSMGIFTTREAAEAFVEGDPFVLEGVVKRWSIREWNEVIA